MKIKKKSLIILIIIITIIILCSCFFISNTNNKVYSYEWVKEQNSVINQQRLYVNNKRNKHVEGYVRITYLNGKSNKVKISKNGKLFVKSVVKKVRIINKR